MSANELDMKVDQIRDLKRLIEEAEAEITSIEDAIKARMTELDTDTMRGDKCKVTWKQTSSTRIDSKALKKELPDIAAKYSSTNSTQIYFPCQITENLNWEAATALWDTHTHRTVG